MVLTTEQIILVMRQARDIIDDIILHASYCEECRIKHREIVLHYEHNTEG